MLDFLTDVKTVLGLVIGGLMWGIIRYYKIRKAKAEASTAEIKNTLIVKRKEQEEEDERIKVRAEGAFPYVMGWINEQQQGLNGQKELSFSYLRDFCVMKIDKY